MMIIKLNLFTPLTLICTDSGGWLRFYIYQHHFTRSELPTTLRTRHTRPDHASLSTYRFLIGNPKVFTIISLCTWSYPGAHAQT